MLWIFEKDNLLPGDDQLIVAAVTAGHKVHYGKVYENTWDMEYEPQPTIIRGSLNFIRSHARSEGVYCGWEDLRCVSYYPHFGKHLLNYKCLFLPFGMLKDEPSILNYWSNEVFVRPDRAGKQFSGQVINLEGKWPSHLFKGYPHSDLCLFSSVKEITREFRVVCRKNQVVSYNGTSGDGHYAQQVLDQVQWHPDNLWVMDMAIDNMNRFSVVELNSFSASGLEGWFDFDKIVKEAAEQATEDFEQWTK